MKKTKISKSLSLFLSALLIAATAMFFISCDSDTETPDSSSATSSTVEESTSSTVEATSSALTENGVEILGDGETTFSFTMVDVDGTEKKYKINTDKAKVGEALEELGLIQGEEGAYGIFVKTVCGITHEYEVDGKYWAFYIDGEYAMTGADVTQITDGESYMFKAE